MVYSDYVEHLNIAKTKKSLRGGRNGILEGDFEVGETSSMDVGFCTPCSFHHGQSILVKL
jgi:hypothetical protein